MTDQSSTSTAYYDSINYDNKKPNKFTNISSALPRIESLDGKILSVDQYNKLLADEMSIIRKMQRRRSKDNKSVKRLFKITNPFLLSNK